MSTIAKLCPLSHEFINARDQVRILFNLVSSIRLVYLLIVDVV